MCSGEHSERLWGSLQVHFGVRVGLWKSLGVHFGLRFLYAASSLEVKLREKLTLLNINRKLSLFPVHAIRKRGILLSALQLQRLQTKLFEIFLRGRRQRPQAFESADPEGRGRRRAGQQRKDC